MSLQALKYGIFVDANIEGTCVPSILLSICSICRRISDLKLAYIQTYTLYCLSLHNFPYISLSLSWYYVYYV